MLIDILLNVIVPIFALIGIGILLDRRFTLDLPTLSKLNFYVFVPALSFDVLMKANIASGAMMAIGVFSLLHVALLFALTWFICMHPVLRPNQTVLAMGTVFYNAGNYGIPVILLAFGEQLVGAMAIVLVVQNLLTFTLGIWLMERKVRGTGKALAGMLKVPIIYAVAAALLLRAFHVTLPHQIQTPLSYLAAGLIPIALLTLGVQLSRTRLSYNIASISTVSVLRLVVSPLLAAVLVVPFHFAAPLSSVLIVAAGFPVAVNLYILSAEYQQDEKLASQAIFITTLLSALTISGILLICR
ncbi:MAG: AEC family transporter [Armatimonadota bacterium]